MSDRVVLDSWAVLTLLEDGPNAGKVEAVLNAGEALMSWINLGEVAYIVTRRRGQDAAHTVVADVRGIVDVQLPDVSLVLAAATIKAAMPMAYADAFAVAIALRFGVPLMTGDPELLVEPKKTTGIASWQWIDLR